MRSKRDGSNVGNVSKTPSPKKRRLLSLTQEHWGSIYELRERLMKLTPEGVDAPAIETVARNAMSLGLEALARKIKRQEKKLQDD